MLYILRIEDTDQPVPLFIYKKPSRLRHPASQDTPVCVTQLHSQLHSGHLADTFIQSDLQ